MKIYVEKVIRYTEAERVDISSLRDSTRFVSGKVGTAVEVKIYAVSESDEDAAAWESAVGKFLSVYEPDLTPGESNG